MIKDELQSILRSVFAQPELELYDEMSAKDVDGWDSLAHIQLIVAVEKHFKVKFKNAEIARLKNVGDLIQLIAKYYQ
ncbi:acyl carrier protein [soil metagenome]